MRTYAEMVSLINSEPAIMYTMAEIKEINKARWFRIGEAVQEFVGGGKRRDMLYKICEKHKISYTYFKIGYNEYCGPLDEKYYLNF
jgi:hypothetical protein